MWHVKTYKTLDLFVLVFGRYLKNVFPKADETLLLDILSSEDNNVIRATEKLKMLGFDRRDTPPPPPLSTLSAKREEESEREEMARPTPPPRLKSLEEKNKSEFRFC